MEKSVINTDMAAMWMAEFSAPPMFRACITLGLFRTVNCELLHFLHLIYSVQILLTVSNWSILCTVYVQQYHYGKKNRVGGGGGVKLDTRI
jgi:hypothetical protein